jgi:uncharacterized protein (TIGR03663 family)
MSRRERWAWAGLLVLAAVLRLWALGDRPPHHDESVHGNFGHVLLSQGAYRYDPTYHGPLLFYTMAPIFAVFGESDFTARLYPALAGVALVGLAFFLRRRIGRGAAWWTGLLATISPSFLYYSRFARNEAPVVLFSCTALVLVLLVRRTGRLVRAVCPSCGQDEPGGRFVRDGGARLLPWAGFALALHAISKETIYVYAVLWPVAAWVTALLDGVWLNVRRAFAWVDRYRIQLLIAGLVFGVVSVTAYTFFFIHPEDAFFPVKAISYWYNQHKVQRVGGPWFYHLPRLALYEALPIVAALAWVVRRNYKLKRVEAFCIGLGVTSIAMFAYLGEKVPWLVMHQVWPFLPLAGAQLARTFSAQGRWWSRTLAGLGILATAWSALASSFLYPALTTSDPHGELIVFVQTTPEMNELAKRGVALGRAAKAATPPGEGTATPFAAVSGEASWPLSWQWTGLPVSWAVPGAGQQPAIVVCDPGEEERVTGMLGPGYSVRRVPLRAWWVEEYGDLTARRLLRWFLTRETWSPIGATEVSVFEKREPK